MGIFDDKTIIEAKKYLNKTWSTKNERESVSGWLGTIIHVERRRYEYKNNIRIENSEWIEIVILIYEYISLRFPEAKRSYFSAVLRERVYAIIQYGDIKGDPVRDVDIVYQTLFQCLPFSYEILSDKITKLEGVPTDIYINEDKEVLDLISTCIKYIQKLINIGHIRYKDKITPWINLINLYDRLSLSRRILAQEKTDREFLEDKKDPELFMSKYGYYP